MISNIQVLRAFAALAVVFYHTGYFIDGRVHTDFQGVAVFFVISGFIMVHISRKDAGHFLLRRVIRIVPLYWAVTLLSVVWYVFGFANPLRTLPILSDWLVNDRMNLLNWIKLTARIEDWQHVQDVIRSLFFVPYRSASGSIQPVMGVGWTLNLEMFFYLVFSVCLLLNQRFAPLMACLVLLAFKVIWLTGLCTADACELYASHYTVFFIEGVIVFYLWDLTGRRYVHKARPFVVAAAVGAAGFLVWFNYHLEFMPAEDRGLWPWLGGLAPMLLVWSALMLHTANCRVRASWLIGLGNASYALYLIHTLVLDTQRTLVVRWSYLDAAKNLTGVAVGVMISVILAWLLYQHFEKPILDGMNRLLRLNRPAIGNSDAALSLEGRAENADLPSGSGKD